MPIPQIHDLSDVFRQASWTGDPRQDVRQFPEYVRRVLRGVYVHYLKNDHEYPVHDRNGERLGKGKRLILPGGATIKFGKFEDGLIRRRSQDAEHMHRRAPGRVAPFDPAPGTFAECLKLALVLDLTGYGITDIRAAECQLRTRIRGFLDGLSLLVQDHRGDYRILQGPAPADLEHRLGDWARHEFHAVVDRLR